MQKERERLDEMYRAERDNVLRSLDVEALVAHMIKWKRPVPENWGKADAPLAIMHRARLQLPSFTYEEKVLSAQWLVAHQYPLPPPMLLSDGVLFGVR